MLRSLHKKFFNKFPASRKISREESFDNSLPKTPVKYQKNSQLIIDDKIPSNHITPRKVPTTDTNGNSQNINFEIRQTNSNRNSIVKESKKAKSIIKHNSITENRYNNINSEFNNNQIIKTNVGVNKDISQVYYENNHTDMDENYRSVGIVKIFNIQLANSNERQNISSEDRKDLALGVDSHCNFKIVSFSNEHTIGWLYSEFYRKIEEIKS